MRRMQFGAITVDAFLDGEIHHPLKDSFDDADVDLFRSLGGVDEAGELFMPITTYVIRSGGRLIMVDTGIGPDLGVFARTFGGTSGLLPAALKEGGVDPERVDTVVLTHLHADHIGWNVSGPDASLHPTFPNARYLLLKEEWAHWSELAPDVMGGSITRCVRTIEQAGQLEPVDDGHEPAPGVRLLHTPGHTPGHASVLVMDGDAGGVITGDALHHPAEIERPILARFDHKPELAAASRSALLDRVEAEGLTVLGGHFPAPGAGRVLRVEQQRRWHPLGA